MDKSKTYYINECIDMVTKMNQYDYNLLLVKHYNTLNVEKSDVGEGVVFHSYRTSQILNPFEPFLDIIKAYLQEKEKCFIDDFWERAETYSLHRKIIWQYINGEMCSRQEELLVGEYFFEKRKFRQAILNMLSIIAEEKAFCIVLDEMNRAGSAAIWILSEIATQQKYRHIKIVAIFNEEGGNLPFVQEKMTAFVKLCEENDMVYAWLYEDMLQLEENEWNEKIDVEDSIKRINDTLCFLECNQVEYFLNAFMERVENNKIVLEPEQKLLLLQLHYWVNLIKEDYVGALNQCSQAAKLSEMSDRAREYKVKIILSKALVYVYQADIERGDIELLLAERFALEYQDDFALFKIELLRNMLIYSGWKNIWMCDTEEPVSDALIDKCHKYGYLNHLAHIYAYSYNSDFALFTSMENLEDRIVDFNKGIEIGERLNNGKFLIDAYRKNVMLASSNGCFKICIYFYEKMLKIALENNEQLEEAGIYNGLGYSNCGIEQYKEANEYYSKALLIYYKYQIPDDIVETLYNLGINAMQAGDYENACNYLLEADYILHTLNKSTLRVCDISKLYGLIALSSFRVRNMHRAHLYFKKAKEFLSEVFSVDDSMFLVHLLLGEFKYRDKRLDEAKKSFDEAEVYMRRMPGTMFLNYTEFICDYYCLLMEMGLKEEALKQRNDYYKFCEINHYTYKKARFDALIQQGNSLVGLEKFDMGLDKLEMEDISDFVNKQRNETEKVDLLKTIRFFDILQNITNHMSHDVKEEIATIIPMFKNSFSIDKVFLFRVNDNEGNVLYSDLEYTVSGKDMRCMIDFFKKRTIGFLVSKDGLKHDEFQSVMQCFAESWIISFAAVPVYENQQLVCVAIIYTELKHSTIASREKSFMEERELEVYTYIFSQIFNAIDKFEMETQLVETNKKIHEQIEQVLELKNEAEEANSAKSNFLANMSHEIRTPMNAIIGMAEVVLRGDLSVEQRENIYQIKESAKALLAIINDILDISKIESGKMELIVDKYYLHSIIRDAGTIIVTRIGDKPLEFIVDIAPDIPLELWGDCVRIRQIIINLVNNAVKFTKEGIVKLIVDCEYTSEDEIMMKIIVEDTGMGIKQEDLKKLFNSFQQVDSKRNRNIEGTGLGLSITKQLLALMGGDIKVESEYGKGSRFICNLPQKVEKKTIIEIDKSKVIRVAFYIQNLQPKLQLKKDLERMNIQYEEVMSEEDLLKLTDKDANYIFVEDVVLTESIIWKFQNESEIKGILLKDFKKSYGYTINNMLVLNKPMYSLELMGIFYGAADYLDCMDSEADSMNFTAPDANILIVDDNTTNLKVAVGLLEPLNMNVETATSGKEAVEKISSKKYDIVFMDHMMPEIDGVETTHIIRRFHPEYDGIPIIALTANAVYGIKDYFIGEGMNDFVAKPIDMFTIVSKIRTWLPDEKIKEGSFEDVTEESISEEVLQIPGLDTDYALKLVGKEKVYWSILKDYYQNIDNKISLIDSYEKNLDIQAYTIEVHALKSASRQIGALELADLAEMLEKAGKNEDIQTIHADTPELLEKYQECKKLLEPYFEKTNEDDEEAEKEAISTEILYGLLNELKEALDELDLSSMDAVMQKMMQYQYSVQETTLFDQLKVAMDNIDLEVAEEIIGQADLKK